MKVCIIRELESVQRKSNKRQTLSHTDDYRHNSQFSVYNINVASVDVRSYFTIKHLGSLKVS